MSKPEPTTAQIEQVIKEISPASPGQAPLEIVIDPTEKFVAQTPQEMLDKLASAKLHSNQHISRVEAENREQKNRIAELEAKIPKPPADPNAEQAAEWFTKWAQKPDDANMESFARKMGIPADQLVPLLRNVIESSTAMTAAEEFKQRHPDFPETQQNAILVRQALANRFGTGPAAATADNLELVYHDLVRKGQIIPNQIPVSAITNPTTPLPNLRGGSAPPDEAASLTQRLMDLPIDEHKKVLERLMAQQSGRR